MESWLSEICRVRIYYKQKWAWKDCRDKSEKDVLSKQVSDNVPVWSWIHQETSYVHWKTLNHLFLYVSFSLLYKWFFWVIRERYFILKLQFQTSQLKKVIIKKQVKLKVTMSLGKFRLNNRKNTTNIKDKYCFLSHNVVIWLNIWSAAMRKTMK